MSELSKNQLTTENNNSFPNNNTGYITPTLLRTFNQNMIDSLVDEQQYNVDSASFNARINVLDPSGSAQAITSLEIATASLNAYTASQNIRNTSYSSSISALQTWSSSLDATYATDAQLSASVSALSSSVTVTTNGLSSSIGALQQFSSSLDATYATDAQLSASASTLQNNINSLSQSVAVTDLAQSQSIAALQSWSSSLDTVYATDAQLSASASTLQNNINTKLDSASFNSYTASQSSNISASLGSYLLTSSFNTYTQSAASGVSASINTATSSLSQSISASIGSLSSSNAAINASQLSTQSFNLFTQSVNTNISQINARVSSSATTGSNTFIGNQIVSGNVDIEGNITAISASFLYVKTVYETASVIFSSGSNQLGDELIDVQTLSGSVKVQGTLTVNGVPVQTSSFDASGYLLTSSFNTYTQSAASGVSASINSATQSLSSSIAVTTNNLDLEVNQKLDTGSFNSYTQSNDTKVNALIAATASYAISSSVANTFDAFSSSISLTYATKTELSASASTLQNGINSKVENSTFNSYTSSQNTINQGLSQAIQTRLTTASFNSYTQSNDSKVNSLIAATGSYITSAQTSSMSVLSSSFAVTASYALNVTPTDVTPFLSKSVFDAYTGSAALGVSASINSATQSLSSSIAVTTNNLDLEVNGKLDSSSFNSYTQSNNSVVNALVAATASYVTETESGSFVTNIVGTTPTPNGIVVTKGNGSQSTITINNVTSASYSDLALTASFALNVVPTDVSPFLSASVFNAYTQSNDAKVNSLIDKTGSFATTGSNTFNGNQTINGNISASGAITASSLRALSASITYLETIYQTSSVVYSSGSNILGDELTDTQTLSGSVLVQGLLRVNGIAPILVGETASYASASISSSYALSASFATSASQSITASFALTSSYVATSSFALTASEARNVVIIARNGNASSLPAGTLVHITGASGDNPIFNTASYDSELLSSNTLGMLRTTATSGADVEVLVSGIVVGVNTNPANGFVAGDVLYLGPTGSFTRVQPQAPLQTVTIGQVLRAQQNNGSIYVSINNGWELNELHNVAINNPTEGDLLVYRSGSYGLWTNSSSLELGLATTSSNTFIGNQIISGNLLVTGSNINLEVDAPTLGGVGTTNIKTVLDTTASAIVTSVDITRQAAGPTGDNTGIRLQTFSGSSDTTGDRVLSRITTNVNRHTTLGLSGSVVNTQIVGTWGTGSTAFSSQIIATAQSGSATLTLNAGNAASNNAAGTASISAGLIRLGGNAAHRIAPTGSFTSIIIDGVLNQPAFSLRSGSFEVTTPQGSGSFYTNLPLTSSAARINGTTIVKDLIVSGTDGTNKGSIFVENSITASVISASQYIGIISVPSASYAVNADNAVNAQTASYVLNAVSASYVLNAVSASNATLAVTASFANQALSSSFASQSLTASFALNVQNINTASLATTGSNIFKDTQYIVSGAISGTFVDNAGSIYTQSNAVRHIVNLGSASYASIAVPDANTLYVVTGDEPYVLNSQTASFATTGSNIFKGVQIISSSVRGEQYPISIGSNTASFDCSQGNFFTLNLGAGTNHISASNIRQGQTINVRVTTQSTNSVTCSTAIKQPSGSAYVPTNGAGTDILTFIAYDTTLYLVAVKNFV